MRRENHILGKILNINIQYYQLVLHYIVRKNCAQKLYFAKEHATKECFDHRIIKRQKGRQRSSLIFWLFDAAGGGGRDYCETKF